MDRVQPWDAQKWWGSNNVDIARLRNDQWTDWANDWGTDTPTGWWRDLPQKYVYDQTGKTGLDYEPQIKGLSYEPLSLYSSKYITALIDDYNKKNFPWLYDFNSGSGAPVGGVGTVTQDPSFGQFSQDTNVYGEIQAAANKYGVPANFLQAIIAHESSGDWAVNNAKGVVWLTARNQGILPYVGITADAGKSWAGIDINTLVGNRAGQIDLLALGLAKLYKSVIATNPSYGWLNVAAMHYSGNPDLGAASTPSDSYQYGTTQEYVKNVENWWKSLDGKIGNTWSNQSQTTLTGNTLNSPTTPGWVGVNRWDAQIQVAATKYGVPPNLIKAIMRLESGGNQNAVSPQGATGLMQVMPFWNGTDGLNLYDAAQNVLLGAYILKQNYTQYGTWEMAAKAYLGLGGADALGTTSSSYWNQVSAYWKELDATASGLFGGAPTGGGGGNLAAIFGGTVPGISQGIEHNEWTESHKDMYAYGYDYGLHGEHTGIDYVVPYGTQIYSGTAGTVIFVGPGGSFESDYGGPGRIEVRLDNGDSLIYGHMSASNVTVGQRVKIGDKIGSSGSAGSGPHMHLEYRVPDASMPSGQRIIDPVAALNGVGITGGQTGAANPYMGQAPRTFQQQLIRAATGQSLAGFDEQSNAQTWNGILKAAATGSSVASYLAGGQRGAMMNPSAQGGDSIANVSGGPVTGNQQKIVSLAQQYLGTPYVWAGTTPSGWDCSGFVSWLYQNAWGVSISTGSHYQFTQGYAVANNAIQPGDLLFYDTSGGTEFDNGNYASHVGMYIGNGQMIHAANPSMGTIVSNINDSYYTGKFLGARRYV